MRFSILIPVYNVKQYLSQCLDSVMAQTFSDFEVVIADDGSSDGSSELCDEYAKRYPDCIRVFHKKNEGLLLTRRFELDKAKGEYVIFVDSDDYVSKDLLLTVDRAIKEYQCDMVIYNFYRFVDGESIFTTGEVPYPSGTVFAGEGKRRLYQDYIINHTFVNMWIKAVKREVIDVEYDYQEWNVSRGEDVIQTFALFDKAKSIVFVDEKLYYYRKNKSSKTMQTNFEDYKAYLTQAERTSEYIAKWNVSASVKADFIERQISRFYFYLRAIDKKAINSKDDLLLRKTIEALGNDERFYKMLKVYAPIHGSQNYKFRMRIFKRLMCKRYWSLAETWIKLSNRMRK